MTTVYACSESCLPLHSRSWYSYFQQFSYRFCCLANILTCFLQYPDGPKTFSFRWVVGTKKSVKAPFSSSSLAYSLLITCPEFQAFLKMLSLKWPKHFWNDQKESVACCKATKFSWRNFRKRISEMYKKKYISMLIGPNHIFQIFFLQTCLEIYFLMYN